MTDPADELASLAAQSLAWAELDLGFGVSATVGPPRLAGADRPRDVARPARAPAPIVSPAPVRPATVEPAPVAAPLPPSPAVARVAPTTLGPLPGSDEPALVARRAGNAPRLAAIQARLEGCTRCALAAGRQKIVFGQGDPAAELVFVGEAPGEVEDRTGLAFVGPAGELLTKMIAAMGLTRDEVYIANIAKCRPPGNRPPAADEMATCLPFLEEQLDVIRPKVICALGKTAGIGLGLLRAGDAITRLRGRFYRWRETPVMLTFHPSYLLRSPDEKRKTWQDLQQIFPMLERRRTDGPRAS